MKIFRKQVLASSTEIDVRCVFPLARRTFISVACFRRRTFFLFLPNQADDDNSNKYYQKYTKNRSKNNY